MDIDLADRLFNIAVRVIKFLRYLPCDPEYNNIRYQLSKSSSSSGANYEEAQAASSKADFLFKIEIALREMRETNYWLRLIKAILDVEVDCKEELVSLINESAELKNILGKIASSTRNNMNSKPSM
jgi:four helix bundle protein